MQTLGSNAAEARVFAHSRYDAILVALSFVHAGLLFAAPSIVLIAVLLWWSSNTVSHNFIHLPFFGSRAANRAYSIYLSLLLGFPQSLWRDRHLAHHTGGKSVPLARQAMLEAALIALLWLGLALVEPGFFFTTYLPGYAVGLALCRLHGHFEHEPETQSHYGALYNAWFFNDGYHVEHHARPDCHWASLPAAGRQANASRFPAVLRWLPVLTRAGLEGLERLALRSPRLMRFLLARHEAAFARLAPRIGEPKRIAIVGGGLFPRSAMVCRRLFPDACIRIIDASARNIETATALLEDNSVELEHATFKPGQRIEAADLAVIPLSLRGGHRFVYASPPAKYTLVHDWLWAHVPGAASAVVSCWLLKRVNLVERR